MSYFRDFVMEFDFLHMIDPKKKGYGETIAKSTSFLRNKSYAVREMDVVNGCKTFRNLRVQILNKITKSLSNT